ncbi:MAG: 3-hydroxyacyl-ACP dehydratase FabZ [Proteobacteria bacterium]|nr:3-hydroxyacyl-ACP dehydratase FabZ [Pseudomonadota bacterium]
MTGEMDVTQIQKILPHRYPFLLVDRVVSFEAEKRILALKNVTINEPFFQGHFPNWPVMPGVLIIEALGQAGGLLAMLSIGGSAIERGLFFVSLEKAKFRRPVTPGDRLELDVEVLRTGSRFWRFKGRGMVDGQLAAECEFTAGMGPEK